MLRALVVLLGASCLIGCRTAPPVQEMSDARQAIAAARSAGAAQGASSEFDAAQLAISRAEEHLQAMEYTRARYAALQAKHHAAAALDRVQQHPDAAGTPVPP